MNVTSTKRGTTKIIVQSAGAMVALTGLYLCFRVWVQAGFSTWPLLLLPLVPFVGYFGYLGYVAWWRFTPGAVRHICGTVAFFLFFVLKVPLRTASEWLSQQLAGTEMRLETIEGGVLILELGFLFWGYQRAWPYLVKAVFGEQRDKI